MVLTCSPTRLQLTVSRIRKELLEMRCGGIREAGGAWDDGTRHPEAPAATVVTPPLTAPAGRAPASAAPPCSERPRVSPAKPSDARACARPRARSSIATPA